MPVPERVVDPRLVLLWFGLMAGHAALYWFGERIRQRYGLPRYLAAQGVLLFAIVATRAPAPVSTALYMAATAELIVLAGERWGTIPITLGAIALFVVSAIVGSSLYYATTAGLALAVTGVVGHAFAALARRRSPHVGMEPLAVPASNAANGTANLANLSARETEVLRELVNGARNSDIATQLGISERTVKSHLKSIYQKLGVETRSAAVASAVQRKLV